MGYGSKILTEREAYDTGCLNQKARFLVARLEKASFGALFCTCLDGFLPCVVRSCVEQSYPPRGAPSSENNNQYVY
eukprot:5481044-Pleurochrysis_carterae.AAC.1